METEIRTLQVNEALTRMQMLNIMGSVRNAFKRSGRVFYSERQSKFMDGILYYLDNNPKYVKFVKEFEKKYNTVVYHAQLIHTNIGTMLSLLYVSSETEEWPLDRRDLANGEVYAYVVNLDCPDDSEIGLIGVKPVNGGITRTW